MTVAQNICVVPKLLKWPKEKCDQVVHDLLEMVNMPFDQYAHKYPSEMSGGQQQRIGILRALAASPPVVLMDEPFSALDPMTRRSLQIEVKNLQQKLNKTIIFVTHDMEEALGSGRRHHLYGPWQYCADGPAGGDAGKSRHRPDPGFPG